jgi:putative endonuclease
MRGGWVYIVTNHLHGLNLSAPAEYYPDIRDAIQRECNIKHWRRAWKVWLVHADNPEWRDLYDDLIS